MIYSEFVVPIRMGEDPEIILAELVDMPFDSFVESDEAIRAFVPGDLTSNEGLHKKVEEVLNREVTRIEHPDKNWNEVWEEAFDPINVGDDLRVRAPFHSPDPTKEEIVISPKMSFGTGHHETTYLMLETMKEMNWSDKEVLDMGSGTGVLGIYAAKKGAKTVVCIDIDDWAVPNTLENASLNGVEDIQVLQGDRNAIPDLVFDCVLANINRNVLIEDMGQYADHLKPKGQLLMSGVLIEDENVIDEKAISLNLSGLGRRTRGNWISLLYEKS